MAGSSPWTRNMPAEWDGARRSIAPVPIRRHVRNSRRFADPRRHLDLVTLDANGFGAVGEKPAERSLRLETDQQAPSPSRSTASS